MNHKKWHKKLKTYILATKESERSEQCLTRISVRQPALQTTTDPSMLSILRSNSALQNRGNSAAESKCFSRSSTELRQGSLQAWFQALHTRIAPRHRSSNGRRERTLMRHSLVNSAQSATATANWFDSVALPWFPFSSFISMTNGWNPFGVFDKTSLFPVN